MENELDFQPEDDGQMNLGQIDAIKRQREKKALMNQEYIGKLESTFNKKMNNSEKHRVNQNRDKDAKLKSLAEKQSILKQRTIINKEIQDVNHE